MWKVIERDYEVSNKGQVRSIKFNEPYIVKTRIDRYGYEIVTLHIDGKALTRKVHRLVAIAFIENPENLETVNHIDGNKRNNIVSNLEWLSVKENHSHAFRTGLHKIGEGRTAGRKARLTDSDVTEIKQLIREGFGNTEIGKKFKVTCGCIYSIRMNKSWTHIK